MIQQRVDAVVLGAGISGLAAGRALQERGAHLKIIEAAPSIGGLTRTVDIGDFCFDYTGHLLHLARYGSPSSVPFAGLCDSDWQTIDRRSFCLFNGRLIPAPIQYNLGHLHPDDLRACLDAYERRPTLDPAASVTFRDFLVSGFGEFLSDRFLIPQNEKSMATSLDRLSGRAVRRFFPPPDDELVRAGLDVKISKPKEYNSSFWYPRIGGIGRLVDGLSAGLDPSIDVLQEAVRLDLAAHTISTSGGRLYEWNTLFSSIPLRDLCRISSEPELQSIAARLTHSATISINLGIKGPLPPELENAHWIYTPDKSLPFYRVGFYSNITAGMCPSKYSSVYAEVGGPSDVVSGTGPAKSFEPKVLEALGDLGWVTPDRIVCRATHVIPCAYVHHTHDRDVNVARATDLLRKHGVHLIGRYGTWDYTSMEDSIHSAISMVNNATIQN